MKLVIGLGNPGKEYENTRHNVGFMVLDSFFEGFEMEKKFQAMVKRCRIDSFDVLFVKPLTFMNLSGDSVFKIVQYYHIDLKDILVIQDDLDLPFECFKIKENSSSGGHNGIKSIIHSLKSQNFCRLKIGIAHDKDICTIQYVLQKFSKKEMSYFEDNYSLYKEIIYFWIVNGGTKTMARYNHLGGKKL